MTDSNQHISRDFGLLWELFDAAPAQYPQEREALTRIQEQLDALVRAGDALCGMLATPNGPRANQLDWFAAKRAAGYPASVLRDDSSSQRTEAT